MKNLRERTVVVRTETTQLFNATYILIMFLVILALVIFTVIYYVCWVRMKFNRTVPISSLLF